MDKGHVSHDDLKEYLERCEALATKTSSRTSGHDWFHRALQAPEPLFVENTRLKKEIEELKVFIENHFKQMAKEMECNDK